MNVYLCRYRGQTIEVHAATTYEAQTKAAAHFKARKPWEVITMRADVVHTPVD